MPRRVFTAPRAARSPGSMSAVSCPAAMKLPGALFPAMIFGIALCLGITGLRAAPTLISDPTTDEQTLNTNGGIAMLSNGGHANLYLHQVTGDQATYEPTGPGFSAQVIVYDAANQRVATVTADEPASSGASVAAAAIAPLANGGFVVVWSSMTATGEFGAVYYATFDNNGVPAGEPGSRHHLVSSRLGYQVQVAGLTGGGFAVVFASGDNGAAQRDFVCTYSHDSALNTFSKINEVQLGWPGETTTTAADGTARLFISSSSPRIAALSDGSFVVMEPTYVWVRSTYTPLGDHVYRYSSAGDPVNFSNGFPHLRINWSQVGAPGDMVALSGGGFATINRNYNGNWELNIFNNDGTYVVSSPQTQQVYQDGSYVTKSYNAIRVANVAGGNNRLAAITESGSNLILAITSSNGFDILTRSKTTGAAVGSTVDAGVSPAVHPTGRYLTNPWLAPTGEGGWGMTFDDIYFNEVTYYATAATYQVGFVAANSAPTISDVPDQSTADGVATGAIALIVGDAETAAGSLTVSASSSNTALVPNTNLVFGGSGANRTVTVTPVAGKSGTTTITLTVTDGGGLTATDTFVLTVNDITPPTVVSVERLSPDAQAIGPATTSIVFRITYSEAVTNVTAADFAIEGINGGTVAGSVTEVSGTGTMREVTATITGGSGEFRLNVVDRD